MHPKPKRLVKIGDKKSKAETDVIEGVDFEQRDLEDKASDDSDSQEDEQDKPKMWTLNAQAEFSEFSEDWGDSEDPVSEGQPPEENASEQDPPTERAPQGARE